MRPSLIVLKMLYDIAEHSMCQPGRPLPHGDSHSGSPGLLAFHSAKSLGLFFSEVNSSCSAASLVLPTTSGTRGEETRRPTQLAVGVVLHERRRVEVHAAVHGVRVAVRNDALDHRDDLGNVLGWKEELACTSDTRVITFAVRQPSVFMSSMNSFSYLRARSLKGMPRSLELRRRDRRRLPVDDLVIDIGDVHHEDDVVVEVVAQNSHDDVLAQVGSGNEVLSGSYLAWPMCATS